MTGQQRFGGDWTEEKLERISKYLKAYTTILSKQPLRFAYIDAFAGTGYRELKQKRDPMEPLLREFTESDSERFLQGSVRIALSVEPRFDKYIFIEKADGKFIELESLTNEFPSVANDIMLVKADCNAYLQDLCLNRNWKENRAVLFLDPFGMQVEWRTIEAIAHTKAIDLWLLFPLGVAVNRLLRRDGLIEPGLRKRLDELFGTEEWYEAFYQEKTQKTLFGEETHLEKSAGLAQIGEYFVARLKTVFPGVAENPLPLFNSRRNPLYLLCFAAGNPKGAKTAVKIAQDILGK